VLVSEPDDGLYNAMNKGIAHSTGEVLFFLNADDVFHDPDVVADVMAAFAAEPELDVVYGEQVMNINGRRVPTKPQPDPVTRAFLRERTVFHQTVFSRRRVFEATNGFSECYKVVSDYEWMLKVFLGPFRTRHIDRVIVVFDTGGRSWSTRWEAERLQVMREHFGPWETFWHRTIKLHVRHARKAVRERIKHWLRSG